MTVLDRPSPTRRPVPAAPRLVEGTELIGQYRGSGYQESKYLVGRGDGQVVQLSQLLYELATALDGRHGADELAARVSDRLGRDVSAEQVEFLLENKLRPAGIAADDAGTAPVAPLRPDPLLLLKYRVRVIPEGVVRRIAAVFLPLHWPPVVVALLAAFLGLDVALVLRGGLGAVAPSTIAVAREPALALLVLGMIAVAGVFHECGHVAACRYGGARPGVMGVGLYLIWPAYYSTVTDSYRLSRAGRLRVDLGGVYFNAVFIVATTAAYLWTDAPWLLLAVVALHVETAWQFLPSIRLDGYYILSDLIGLPDLFMFLVPVLKSVVPGREPDPRIAELRPGVRRTIIAWVLLVVPFILFFLIFFIVTAPEVVPAVWATLLDDLAVAAQGFRTGDSALASLGVVQAIFLLLPVIGMTLLVGVFARMVGSALRAPQPAQDPAGGAGRAAPVTERPESAAPTPAKPRPSPRPRTAPPAPATPKPRPSSGPRTAPAASPAPEPPVAAGPPATPSRPIRSLLVVAIPVVLLGLLTAAGLDQRVTNGGEAAVAAAAAPGAGFSELSWPGSFAVPQISALEALLPVRLDPGDAARTALLVTTLLTSLLLWPLARRIGASPTAAALAVALCGLPVPLAFVLQGSVDAGTLAALWLTVAAALAGRGRGTTVAAAAAAALATLTAPLAAVGLLGFAAHGVLLGVFAASWRRRATYVLAVLLAAAAALVAVRSTGTGPWVVPGGGAVPAALLVGVLCLGAIVVALTWFRARPLRPVATGTAALLACTAVPGPHTTTALLLVVPVLAVLAASVIDILTARAAVSRRYLLAAVIVAGIATSGPLVLAASALDPDRAALSTWARSQVDRSTALSVDPLTAAQLVHDGVPAERLVPAGAAGPPGTLTVAPAQDVRPDNPRLLVTLPVGPGGAPTAVVTDPGEDRSVERHLLGLRLTDNPRLDLTPSAVATLHAGQVDLRLATTLSGLTAAHRIAISDFVAVPAEPVGAPRRIALITAVDGVPVTAPGATDLVARWLGGQQPPYRPATVLIDQGVLVVHYTTPSPLGR